MEYGRHDPEHHGIRHWQLQRHGKQCFWLLIDECFCRDYGEFDYSTEYYGEWINHAMLGFVIDVKCPYGFCELPLERGFNH